MKSQWWKLSKGIKETFVYWSLLWEIIEFGECSKNETGGKQTQKIVQ